MLEKVGGAGSQGVSRKRGTLGAKLLVPFAFCSGATERLNFFTSFPLRWLCCARQVSPPPTARGQCRVLHRFAACFVRLVFIKAFRRSFEVLNVARLFHCYPDQQGEEALAAARPVARDDHDDGKRAAHHHDR